VSAGGGGLGTAARREVSPSRLREGLAGNPARAIALAFLLVIGLGTLVLMLPAASADGSGAPPMTALFTAVSAVCVTGLVVVDTATYWSGFGQAVILALIQIGGLGILTGTSLAFLLLTRRLGFRGRLMTGAERQQTDQGQLRQVLLVAVGVTAAAEAVAWISITLRLLLDGYSLAGATWRGLFHSVSAFNNAGFALWSDNMIGFRTDAWMLTTIAVATIAGGLGVPVWQDLRRVGRRWSRYSLHSRITLGGTVVLLVIGFVAIAAVEWNNSGTLGAEGTGDRVLGAFFASVQPRTAGFNAMDYGEARVETLLVTQTLMLIGGGSASTAGGLKVGTFVVLMLVVWAEARGRDEVVAFGRSIPAVVLRRAFAIGFLALVAVSLGTLVIAATSTFEPEEAFFESVSAFATVGLSTGLTPELNTAGRLTCIVLMFAGRVGLVTVALALAFRERERRFTHPEGRPLIG